MAIASCVDCGYPIGTHHEGETISCPMCRSINEVVSGTGTSFLLFMLGLGIGVFFGPSIISASKGGRVWLEKQAREAESRLKES